MKIHRISFEGITVKVLLLSAILSATLINAAKANAQSTTVNFSGTVPNTCAISTTVDGTLVLDAGGTTMSSSIPGSFILTCNGQVTMDITDFTAVSVPAPISTGTARVNDPFSGQMVAADLDLVESSGTGSVTYPLSPDIIDNETFTVDVDLNNSGIAIQSGTYSYQVDVQVNPQ
jgi:hypothetical protein